MIGGDSDSKDSIEDSEDDDVGMAPATLFVSTEAGAVGVRPFGRDRAVTTGLAGMPGTLLEVGAGKGTKTVDGGAVELGMIITVEGANWDQNICNLGTSQNTHYTTRQTRKQDSHQDSLRRSGFHYGGYEA